MKYEHEQAIQAAHKSRVMYDEIYRSHRKVHNLPKQPPFPKELGDVPREALWEEICRSRNMEGYALRWNQRYLGQTRDMSGRVAILRHENNQLRKKVTTQAERQKNRAPYSPPEPPDVSL